jgi:AAA+ ATPase superfamily predicted ATPase
VIFGVGQVSAVSNTWDDLLSTLAKQAQSERLVVVIDEFPYLVAAGPSLTSILQRSLLSRRLPQANCPFEIPMGML